MTEPTKAIAPLLLEDFRRIMDKQSSGNDKLQFSEIDVKNCMKKVIAVNLHQPVQIAEDFEVCAYYAGHVLGAAMFWIRVGGESIVYTGDFNMTPDRHLGAASIPAVCPDVFISESTYGTTIRDSKRTRERDFLRQVHECVDRGGKVLIPVFALGRAQELCILLETYWSRMKLKVPIYFSSGLVDRANDYYKMFINWTNQKIKNTFVQQNLFDFKHIEGFNPTLLDSDKPMVLFATPGMLHAGTSLEVFKRWCPDSKNLVVIPGFCVAGTIGNKVLTATTDKVKIDRFTTLTVRCSVKHMSFSAHADARGILNLIQQCKPKNVVLVHGEKSRMFFLRQKIKTEMGLQCWAPANGQSISIPTQPPIPLTITDKLLHLTSVQHNYATIKSKLNGLAELLAEENTSEGSSTEEPTKKKIRPNPDTGATTTSQHQHEGGRGPTAPQTKYEIHRDAAGLKAQFSGVLIMKEVNTSEDGVPMDPLLTASQPSTKQLLTVATVDEAVQQLNLPKHELGFVEEKSYSPKENGMQSSDGILAALHTALQRYLPFVHVKLDNDAGCVHVGDSITLQQQGSNTDDLKLQTRWLHQDDELYQRVTKIVDDVLLLM
eukprot:TRINITY_DN54849_c0_g1_i1.p1 TRINITY_DN54849_c0_g1~~TRINITY_DN54849_c0_g1_i1.p1  ORF type:complete len:603 (+),score=44.34 TRINITY_DN54849_c0_g1_i1:115-1923(+)